MSRALQICLMFLTAALCGVCLLEWHRETLAASREWSLAAELATAQGTIRSQQEKLTAWEQEITRLNIALNDRAADQKALPELEAKLTEAARQIEAQAAAAAQASIAGDTLGSYLKKALEERDVLATRLNERTREFNVLAEKYRKVSGR